MYFTSMYLQFYTISSQKVVQEWLCSMMCHLHPIVRGRFIDLAKLLVDATRLEEKLKLSQGLFLWLQVMYVSIIFNCICKKWYTKKTNSYCLHAVFKLWMQNSCAKDDDTNHRFREHNLHIVKIAWRTIAPDYEVSNFPNYISI
jgi:hypothetical protein